MEVYMSTVLHVPEMHCNKCVERITNRLNEEKLDFTVSLDAKTVTVSGDEGCVKTAVSALDDLGFSAEQ